MHPTLCNFIPDMNSAQGRSIIFTSRLGMQAGFRESVQPFRKAHHMGEHASSQFEWEVLVPLTDAPCGLPLV